MTEKKMKNTHFAILFLFSFFAMLFFTKSSPLFLLNDWVDANAYFTMGKGMAAGLVPFRDLFEQKGPLLYLMHAIAYLISNTTFYGIYLFESIGLGVSMLFLYKTARFYLTDWQSLWVSSLLPVFLLYQPYFKAGDSAEEFSIPFVMGLIYFMFRLYHKRDDVKSWMFFLQGVGFGCVFWIKYTLIGAWIGFYLSIFFIMLFKKQWRELIRVVLFSLAGFAAAALPWIIYFAVNGALKDLIDVYFLFNMGAYAPDRSLVSKLATAIIRFTGSFSSQPLLYFFIFIGLTGMLLTDKLVKDVEMKIMFLASFFFTGLAALFGGKSYVYYFQILLPFACFGLLSVCIAVLRKRPNPVLRSNILHTCLILCMSMAMTLSFNQNIKQSRFNTDDTHIHIPAKGETSRKKQAQFVFAEIMNQKENPTMLNYGYIDLGFYTVADIMPINRYFERPNIAYEDYPDIMDEQHKLIGQKAFDFVVAKTDLDEPLEKAVDPVLLENYFVRETHSQKREGTAYTYYLFERKE